jgi:hypothetical protein
VAASVINLASIVANAKGMGGKHERGQTPGPFARTRIGR